MKSFLTRHLPPVKLHQSVINGIGSMIGIGIIALLSKVTSMPWLMAPFGASCVLLFAAPASPLAQPINVVAGHLTATAVGLLFLAVFPDAWWSMSASVGVSIALMVALRITHPPAGADPIVVFWSQPGWDYLAFPVLVGSVILVVTATIFHRLAGSAIYPDKDT